MTTQKLKKAKNLTQLLEDQAKALAMEILTNGKTTLAMGLADSIMSTIQKRNKEIAK